MKEHIEKTLLEKYPNSEVTVVTDGRHYELTIKESSFKDLSLLKKHRAVMALFDPELKDGSIHALSIKFLD